MLGEDIQDEGGAVYHARAGDVLKVALLRGRNLVIQDHEVEAELVMQLGKLISATFAEIGSRVGRTQPLDQLPGYLRSRGACERCQLV
jgi:hypothetical protein